MNKIFGVGWAKTGTKTLGKCFKILGFNHQSTNLDLVIDIKKDDLSRIIKLAANRETFEDWPWPVLFKEMDNAFPFSRFILTMRDPENWIRSYRNMLLHEKKPRERLNEIRQILYQLPFPNVSDDQLIERYNKHNEEVLSYFKDRSKDLLVIDWEKGDGWSKLCNFLNLNIPNQPFPHENRGDCRFKNV